MKKVGELSKPCAHWRGRGGVPLSTTCSARFACRQFVFTLFPTKEPGPRLLYILLLHSKDDVHVGKAVKKIKQRHPKTPKVTQGLPTIPKASKDDSKFTEDDVKFTTTNENLKFSQDNLYAITLLRSLANFRKF